MRNVEDKEDKMHHKPFQSIDRPVPSQEAINPSRMAGNNLNEVLSKLVDLQMSYSAPDIDIDIFSGDPLEYCYFRATFRDVVERKVTEPRGRLTRLLKYTKGDAKELIKHCIHEKESECFNKAIELLDEE